VGIGIVIKEAANSGPEVEVPWRRMSVVLCVDRGAMM